MQAPEDVGGMIIVLVRTVRTEQGSWNISKQIQIMFPVIGVKLIVCCVYKLRLIHSPANLHTILQWIPWGVAVHGIERFSIFFNSCAGREDAKEVAAHTHRYSHTLTHTHTCDLTRHPSAPKRKGMTCFDGYISMTQQKMQVKQGDSGL